MTRIKLRYVQTWFDKRLGRARHVFRRRGFPRVELPGLPGSAEFMAAYQSALAAKCTEIGTDKRSIPGSVSAAIAAYYLSDAWTDLVSEGTRKARRPTLERFRERYGALPLRTMTSSFVGAYLATFKGHARLNIYKTMKAFLVNARMGSLFVDIERPKVKSERIHPWTDAERAQYVAFFPLGTEARLTYAIAFYTGAARSDLAKMGPQHVRDGVVEIKRQKTGVPAKVLIHPDLQAAIDAMPVTGLGTFLVSKTGKPYKPNDLSEQVREWCDQAGLPQCSLHGLRHALGDAMAGDGSTEYEIASVLGHKSPRSALHYSQGADRERMARRAMERRIKGTSEQP